MFLQLVKLGFFDQAGVYIQMLDDFKPSMEALLIVATSRSAQSRAVWPSSAAKGAQGLADALCAAASNGRIENASYLSNLLSHDEDALAAGLKKV